MRSAGPALRMPPDAGNGRRLSLEIAAMCEQLAHLLGTLDSGDQGAGAEGRGVLEAVAASLRAADGSLAGARAADRLPPDPSRTPLARLASGLGLSPLEIDLVVLAGLAEEHEGLAGVLRMLHPRGEPRASVGLAAQLLCRGVEERSLLREALESGPAVTAGALSVDPEGAFFERSLLLPDCLWSAMLGIDAWPASIPRRSDPVAIGGLEEWLDQPAVARGARALAADEPRTILLVADSEEIAEGRAAALARHAGVDVVRVAPAATDPQVERLIGVHALIRGVVPILRVPAVEPPGDSPAISFGLHPGPVVVCARTGGVRVIGPRPLVPVPVEALSPSARRSMWSAALPDLAPEAAYLASRHSVEPAVAVAIATDVESARTLDDRPARVDDVASSVRARAGLLLTSGVKLIRPTAGWAHLVLPADRLAQLQEAVARLRHQSRVLDEWGFLAGREGARGVRMLFAGPPGTGKTLSAEVLATELQVELLSVDISRVVSKWIGETEKNLAEVFDAAERTDAALFFDEADALFGKRTEVSDAHDRYANLETAYLLARLERFEGLAILSTNLQENIDPAFVRRLEFVVDFDEPGPGERAELWRCHLPPEAPMSPDVDVEQLARLYPIVGAMIRNAAVAAGFLAAAEEGVITRSHLIRTIRREYEKSGRAFPGVPVGMTDA